MKDKLSIPKFVSFAPYRMARIAEDATETNFQLISKGMSIIMKYIETEKAPGAIGPYSQAVVAGGFIFTSGQIPLIPETGTIVEGGIKEQTAQVIKNIEAILQSADSNIQKVVKTTCYLKNINDFAEFNAIYSQHFTSKPARSCVEVAAIPKNALVEIEVVAVI